MEIFHLDDAELELDDAFEWYENQVQGLGYDFLDEINKSLKRIVQYPDSCEERDDEIKRCIVNRIPYGIVYGIDKDKIIVVAIAHLHRKPKYWFDRVKFLK
jgi:plasmid stabilization system protein ParE